MAFQDKIGMPLYMVAMLGAIAVCAFSILKGKQVYNLIDMKTVFLYFSMLPLGTTLKETGTAQLIADGLAFLVGGPSNVYLITALVFIVTCFMTQFTSNVVTINLISPIAVAIAGTLNVSPVVCPPATIIYGNGGFKFSDYAKINLQMGRLYCGKFMDALKKYHDQNKLYFHGNSLHLRNSCRLPSKTATRATFGGQCEPYYPVSH